MGYGSYQENPGVYLSINYKAEGFGSRVTVELELQSKEVYLHFSHNTTDSGEISFMYMKEILQ